MLRPRWKEEVHPPSGIKVTVWRVSACVQVLVTNLAELLLQQAPLLQVGFAELLFVSNEQCQFADGTIQHILRALLHQLTKSIRLTDQHSPRLLRKKTG